MKTIKVERLSSTPDNYTGIVELPNGDKYWLLNGAYHREDGPAIEYEDGTKYWYSNGIVHRNDGPAIEWPDGGKEYCRNGMITIEHKRRISQLIDLGYPEVVAVKLGFLG